jgi:hypothetical protein
METIPLILKKQSQEKRDFNGGGRGQQQQQPMCGGDGLFLEGLNEPSSWNRNAVDNRHLTERPLPVQFGVTKDTKGKFGSK